MTTAQTRTPARRSTTTRPRTAARRSPTPSKNGNREKNGGGRARNLVIVESPAKARTVENILGADYRVIASVGHVRDLPNYGYGVKDLKNGDFTPVYVVPKEKKQVVDEIKAAAKGAERVYLSTDPDREGEAISWHILEAAEIPKDKVTRVVFHEITRPAIEAAFREASLGVATDGDGHHRKKPGELDMTLVDAQQARRVLDRLIGFPLTWFVQKKVARSASAGRVQSVALRLIVEREREIQSFLPTEWWSIHAQLAKAGRQFEAELSKLPGETRGLSLRPPFDDRMPAIGTQADADALLAVLRRSDFAVASVKKGERSKSPVPPFTTSTFQQAAVNRLGMSAARAMALAQQLYEGVGGQSGLITYMRTDSLNISPTARGEARRYVNARWGKEYVPEKQRVYRTRSRGAQEAHEAIRPTDVARAPDSLRNLLDRDQLRVYTLIWQRFVASQMSDARFQTVAVEIEAREGGQVRATFRASAQHLTFAGYLAVYGHDATDEDVDEDAEASLPELVEGEALRRHDVVGRQHFTEPPPRYTEASLVKVLEEKGIGRPSTYATIVATVQKRDYVKKEGRALVPQELGFLVNDMLVQFMDEYVAVPFTGEMEDELDEVAEGERGYLSVVREFWPKFEEKLGKAEDQAEKNQEETDIPCEVCGQANLVIKWGRNGKFFACPRYPECKNSMPMDPETGQPVRVAQPVMTEYRCPRCGRPTVRKTGPYGPYVDCTGRDEKACDFRSGVPVGVVCPEEPETGQLVEKQAIRRGKKSVFYGCWNYPSCSYTTSTPGKMTPPRPAAEREAANQKLLERSARGKAAFAKRSESSRVRRAS